MLRKVPFFTNVKVVGKHRAIHPLKFVEAELRFPVVGKWLKELRITHISHQRIHVQKGKNVNKLILMLNLQHKTCPSAMLKPSRHPLFKLKCLCLLNGTNLSNPRSNFIKPMQMKPTNKTKCTQLPRHNTKWVDKCYYLPKICSQGPEVEVTRMSPPSL